MWPTATDVAHSVVCVNASGTTVSCAKTAEPKMTKAADKLPILGCRFLWSRRTKTGAHQISQREGVGELSDYLEISVDLSSAAENLSVLDLPDVIRD